MSGQFGSPPAGDPNWFEFSDASILGGQRQMYARDGHSGTLGNPTALTVDATAGTLEWWGGATAPDERVQYGSAINSGHLGFGPMGGGTPTDLNLDLDLSDTFQIDVVQGTPAGRLDGRFQITLFTGAGNVTWSSPSQEVAGTTVIPLSDFTGITGAHVDDIDGIRVAGSASYFDGGAVTSAKGDGLIISELRFGDPSTGGAAVPEPASIVVWSILGIVGLAFGTRRIRRKQMAA